MVFVVKIVPSYICLHQCCVLVIIVSTLESSNPKRWDKKVQSTTFDQLLVVWPIEKFHSCCFGYRSKLSNWYDYSSVLNPSLQDFFGIKQVENNLENPVCKWVSHYIVPKDKMQLVHSLEDTNKHQQPVNVHKETRIDYAL